VLLLRQAAVFAPVQEVDDQPHRQPRQEPVPRNGVYFGHQIKADDEAQGLAIY